MLTIVIVLLMLLSISIGLGYALGKVSLENPPPQQLPKWFDQINAAIALVIALLLVLSIPFRNILWASTGGFIVLVSGMYLYLRFSSARFYLRLNIPVHLVLLCSYPLIAFPVWKITVKGLEPGLSAIFDAMLMFGIMLPGIILLVAGIIAIFVGTNFKYK